MAPLTTTTRGRPARIAVRFQDKTVEVALDQLRAVGAKLVRRVGAIGDDEADAVVSVLAAMLARA